MKSIRCFNVWIFLYLLFVLDTELDTILETHFHLTYDTIVKYQQNLDSIDEYFEAFFDYMGSKEQGTTVDDSYLYFSTFDKLSTIPSIVAMIEKCLCFFTHFIVYSERNIWFFGRIAW